MILHILHEDGVVSIQIFGIYLVAGQQKPALQYVVSQRHVAHFANQQGAQITLEAHFTPLVERSLHQLSYFVTEFRFVFHLVGAQHPIKQLLIHLGRFEA